MSDNIMKQRKLNKQTVKGIEDRQKFLNVYKEFNDLLEVIGFRPGHYWNESSTSLDINYWSNEKEKNYIDSLHSVEHYVNDTLKLSIRFLRDRNYHIIYEVGGLMSRTVGIPLEEYKEALLKECQRLKEKKLQELNSLKL